MRNRSLPGRHITDCQMRLYMSFRRTETPSVAAAKAGFSAAIAYLDEWQTSSSGAYFETHNPYAREPWALIPRCTEADAARAVEATSDAFERGAWPAMTATQRGALLRKLGDLLAEHAEPLTGAHGEGVGGGDIPEQCLARKPPRRPHRAPNIKPFPICLW